MTRDYIHFRLRRRRNRRPNPPITHRIEKGFPEKELKDISAFDSTFYTLRIRRWNVCEHRRGDCCVGYNEGNSETYDRVEAKNLGYAI